MENSKGARNFAQSFYSSKAWEKRSRAYRQDHPLCEKCLKAGRYEPARVVHHKIHIDNLNWHDAKILFNEENLESLCMDCHAEEHRARKADQFRDDGTLVIEDSGDDIWTTRKQ